MDKIINIWNKSHPVIKIIFIIIVLYLIPSHFYKLTVMIIISLIAVMRNNIDELIKNLLNIKIDNTTFMEWKTNGNTIYDKYSRVLDEETKKIFEDVDN